MNTHNSGAPTHRVGTSDRAMQGGNLRAVMETALSERQMSVSALARAANVQRADIYRWWRGDTRPSRNSLVRVAGALGVEPAYLSAALGDATSDRISLIEAIDRQTAVLERILEAITSQPRPSDAEAVDDLREWVATLSRSHQPSE